MKFLNWMQSKLKGRQGTNKPSGGSTINHSLHEPRKDEFSDWPHGLLAIGTFGNNDPKEDSSITFDSQENPSSSEEQFDFTPEEVGKLQKELTKLLSSKPTDQLEIQTRDGTYNLPLDKFLNCPSSLEVDRTICNKFCDDSDNKDTDIEHSTSVVSNKGKDVCVGVDGNNAAIKKKSISFLLKKMFACRSGFAPSPSLRDPISETRMEKLLRAILTKKIYPQRSSTSSKKYLESRHTLKTNKKDQKEKETNGCKWVKTDSEYIVLEI